MSSQISINPLLTTNALGSFSTQSDGYVQGIALDDPSVRNYLAGGVLANAETLPMWGGVGIYEAIPAGGSSVLGSVIGRATSLAALTGFSVFNQAHAGITTPQSPVPLTPSGGNVNFYRLGSGARIAVQADAALTSLDGGLITQQVSWDFNNQVLTPYDASTPTVSVTSMTPSFSNGVYTIAIVCAAASNVGAVGDFINISGATNTGTAGNSIVNGNFQVTAFTDNEHFSIQVTAVSGAIGTIAGTIVLNQGTGALNVRVLQVVPNNCKTVSYSAATGFATWNPNGACALILI